MKLLLALVLASYTLAAPAKPPTSYSFGIVPQQSASKLARLWAPLLAKVSTDAGIRLQFATAPNIPTFEERLADGHYDFAYMNPYHYTVFHESPGYRALAKARDKRIKGIIVVRKDDPIEQLGELDGTSLAFPAPAAFAASILPRAQLSSLNLAFQPVYVSSHDSVYRTVAMGLFPAGGGVIRTFNNVAREIREQLRILWKSDGYTPHAIAAHPRVEPHAFERIQAALVRLDEDESGVGLLEKLKINGLVAATNADWDDVRGLNIELLSQD